MKNYTQNIGFSLYPFGSVIQGRTYTPPSNEKYRYGFNGMEKDGKDWTGNESSHLDYGARIYDSRLGKWLSTDYYESKYPSSSPYAFALNNPIVLDDPTGDTVRVKVTSTVAAYSEVKLFSSGEISADANRAASRALVPVFIVTVTDNDGKTENFLFTRLNMRGNIDDNDKVEDRTYDVLMGESKMQGFIKSRWEGTDNVLELRALDDVSNQTINGYKANYEKKRTAIQFHAWGASDGCFLNIEPGKRILYLKDNCVEVTGDGSQTRFMQSIKNAVEIDKVAYCTEFILIHIESIRSTGSSPSFYQQVNACRQEYSDSDCAGSAANGTKFQEKLMLKDSPMMKCEDKVIGPQLSK